MLLPKINIRKDKSRNYVSTSNNISTVLDKSMKTNSTSATPKHRYINSESNINSVASINRSIQPRISIPFMDNIFSNVVNESSKIFQDADYLVKDRMKTRLPKKSASKNSILNQLSKLRLNNYKIRLMREERTKINKKLFEIKNSIQKSERDFTKDYKSYLEFVEVMELNQRKVERTINRLKDKNGELEKKFNSEKNYYLMLTNSLEKLVRGIIILKNYAMFAHKVFNTHFIYEKLSNLKGKNILLLAEQIIKIYEDNMDKIEEEEKMGKIMENENILMEQFQSYEQHLLNTIQKEEQLRSEIIKLKCNPNNKNEISRLIISKDQLNEKLEALNEQKRIYISTFTDYQIHDSDDQILDNIKELYDALQLNKNTILYKEKNFINYSTLCSIILEDLHKKEKMINNLENGIENIINGENSDDKKIMEEVINKRSKEIKKAKLYESLKKIKEEDKKKEMISMQKLNRVVIKGRKVNIKLPIIKRIKKKKVSTRQNTDINNEYLFYSSDENN